MTDLGSVIAEHGSLPCSATGRLPQRGSQSRAADGRQATITGTLKWPLRVTARSGRRARDIDAAVEAGAFYTSLPARRLRDLGVEPLGERRLLVGDGRYARTHVGEARATINGKTVTTLVTFADDDAPPQLGTHTLDGLGLVVDPGARRAVHHK